ncbi:MAG TPA: LytTR family transcriptional regulator DNA-binding domain-containing protein [Allosphingosinicella sp.]|nr:LytTR family transcriptional regulator DNA-binding domain-containing protein [Allosphingosinicella sp.]
MYDMHGSRETVAAALRRYRPRLPGRAPASPDHLESADPRTGWDERRVPGPTGLLPGTNGRRTLAACSAAMTLAFAICTVNALSILHEAGRDGERIAAWQPWITEYTSLLGLLVALPSAVVAERHFNDHTRLIWRACALLLGSFVFSAVHVPVMVALREAWWSLLGSDYSFDFRRDWLYEYRKDLVGFTVVVALLAFSRAFPKSPRSETGRSESSSRLVQIPDGRRTVTIDVEDLKAVSGGGNYIELVLRDGRRRLLRATLAAAELALRDHGFRQTHRSWLIPLDRVQRLDRTASGDFRLDLGDGLEVPLSRRFRGVLQEVKEKLRQRPDFAC